MTILLTIHKKLCPLSIGVTSPHLVLDVTKVKEIVIDFCKQTKVRDLIVIKEKDVEREYKL